MNQELMYEGSAFERRTVHAYVSSHGDVRTSMWLAHYCNDRNLWKVSIKKKGIPFLKTKESLTPLAVRMGRAFSFGSKAFLYSSGMALMMSTRRGTPPYP